MMKKLGLVALVLLGVMLISGVAQAWPNNRIVVRRGLLGRPRLVQVPGVGVGPRAARILGVRNRGFGINTFGTRVFVPRRGRVFFGQQFIPQVFVPRFQQQQFFVPQFQQQFIVPRSQIIIQDGGFFY